MELRNIDKTLYRKRYRQVSIICMLVFGVLGVSSATLLRHWVGNPEGENTWINLAGVLAGLLVSGGIFALFRHRPELEELIYVWKLKRETLRIQNKIHKWKALLQEGNQSAAVVLAFHYQATQRVQYLEDNEFGESETVKQGEAHLRDCTELGLVPDLAEYRSDLLELVK
ncbi:DUF3087 family protein [Marinobacterium jannaschii]|uniref:DUF3087 family protein n=1 Tax=Marinobacterium jannaschii TaxID=64970 RepID=UPI0004868733|nr:DUF3087 family protein [Marinobacterium jannaschii]